MSNLTQEAIEQICKYWKDNHGEIYSLKPIKHGKANNNGVS
jgi:hypothetical protein